MALVPGTLALTVAFAKGLKDKDWFGKQDPYCIVTVGNQTVHTRVAIDGGKNPVWNETFIFNVLNENDALVVLMDQDNLSRDDKLGECRVSFAKAREHGSDDIQSPVVVSKGKQHGIVQFKLKFTTNESIKPTAHPQGYPQPYPPQGYAPQPYPPQGYPPQPYPPQGYPPQPYPPQAYPPQGYPPQQYPPQQYPPQQYPPQQYPPQQYPPQQYPPQPYGAAPPPHQGRGL